MVAKLFIFTLIGLLFMFILIAVWRDCKPLKNDLLKKTFDEAYKKSIEEEAKNLKK